MRWLVVGLALSLAPGLALAQDGEEREGDVVRAADDAFGRRVGAEQIGLYSEGEVRGFDLQSAGNYRVEDHYYARVAGLFIGMDAGTAIRVGANGLRTDFAAPSGVVQYSLPRAESGAHMSLEGGWWGGSGPTLVARYGLASGEGEWSVAGGAHANPWQHYNDGTGGDYWAIGAVPRWRPREGVEVAAVYARSWFVRGSDSGFIAQPATRPPEIERGVDRTQDWMENRTYSTLAGMFASAEAGDGWRFGGSAFLSENDDPEGVFNLLAFTGNGREADNFAVLARDERTRSVSAELTAEKRFTTGRVAHRVHAMARRRDTVARTSPGTIATLDRMTDVDRPGESPQLVVADSRLARDEVGQWAAGLGYRLSIGTALELRVDGQKIVYSKEARAPDGSVRRETVRPWLYSASAAARVSERLTLFASYARGLEEAGVAPGNAANRGEVLPATLARQAELGAKYAIAGGPSLIAGVFDIAKPVPGMRSDGIYTFVGEVRHRGIELSMAGPLTPRLSAVLGATWLDARISGELVDSGTIGVRPIGRPDTVAFANLTWDVPGVSGFSIDGGVSLRGERAGDRENRVELPAYATLQAGIRQRFSVEGKPFTLRARASNILDQFAWNPNASGLWFPNGQRVFTLTLTGEV